MIEDNVQNMAHHVFGIVKGFFEKHIREDAESLADSFEQEYRALIKEDELKELSEVEGLRRLIVSFRPALSSVLQPCEAFDNLLTMMLFMFKASWEGAHRREKEPPKKMKKGPIMPGSDKSLDIKFYCTVCEQDFDIPYDLKAQILNGSDEIEIPKHHDQVMKIRISKTEKDAPVEEEEVDEEGAIEPIELLMGHIPSDNAEYLKVLSVGIDIGSSTSHLVFSRLTLKRETGFLNMTNRFFLVNREIIYEGNIIFTPLIDRTTIDIEAIVKFCEDEYEKAGITRDMVDTGAVIVTGETAKKQNAAEIVKRLSSESGKFVSAAAGPNMESLLGAMGSGIVKQSLLSQRTVLHCDIGGGTSNLAIVSKGQVLSTSCINVGGRLLGIDKDFKIWRIDGPTQFIMNEQGMKYQLGDTIPQEDARTIAREYAKALVEVMRGPAKSPVATELMMTEDLDFSTSIDEYSLSGGVAEMFYGNEKTYDDIGMYLAEEIKNLMENLELPIIEPENKIRATVIGAGAFSLSVSGSTTFFDENIEFPLNNIPVLPVSMSSEEFSIKKMENEIKRAFKTFDMKEGEDLVALYFGNAIYGSLGRPEEWMAPFARAIEKALRNSVAKKKTIIIIFGNDMGKLFGITLRDETSIKSNVLCLDELLLEAGDWIDIGTPLQSTQAFPVTVKSLVFNQDKEYTQEE